ncbi:hypothetical protein B9G54_05885 [Alloscardovia macacae]|uniref:Uncharacterized protein n=1 Tax=Alloscardovia macacae TaxID=1160091 RepID=A0A1Y2ST50_9BIFI|nr:hypothetical protein [Alloscardovia macacae]OTA26090.1 hypothetical protein B9G54_05885 [Alloscardovia macacae]OTA28609.1 hypothetical protein B9T39_06410 [Alloscardovia macacae]
MTSTPLSAQDWHNQFVALNGHKPSLEDYQAALAAGEVASTTPAPAPAAPTMPAAPVDPAAPAFEASSDSVQDALNSARDFTQATVNTTMNEAKNFTSLSVGERQDFLIFGAFTAAIIMFFSLFMPYYSFDMGFFKRNLNGFEIMRMSQQLGGSPITDVHLFIGLLALTIGFGAAVRFAGKTSLRFTTLVIATITGVFPILMMILAVSQAHSQGLGSGFSAGVGLIFAQALGLAVLACTVTAFIMRSQEQKASVRISPMPVPPVSPETVAADEAPAEDIHDTIPSTDEWTRSFEDTYGRVPTEEEFRAAFDRGEFHA